MSRVTVADRIYEHLANHPGARTYEIAEAVGISQCHALNTIRRMVLKGRVISKPSSENCRAYKRMHYIAGSENLAKIVAKRGQEYGSPFGVVMAQLIR